MQPCIWSGRKLGKIYCDCLVRIGFPWCTVLIWKISKKSPKGWYSADNICPYWMKNLSKIYCEGVLVVKAISPKQNFINSVRDEHEKQFLFRIVKCHTKKQKTNGWLHNTIKECLFMDMKQVPSKLVAKFDQTDLRFFQRPLHIKCTWYELVSFQKYIYSMSNI